MVEIITLQTIMINNAQNNFFFKDKGKEMRLQIHGLIEKKKKQIKIINRYTMKNELTLIYNLSVAYFIASTKSLMASAKLFVDEANVSMSPTSLIISPPMLSPGSETFGSSSITTILRTSHV
jgi:hypothetical protein